MVGTKPPPALSAFICISCLVFTFNPLNAELNPICHLLALLRAHHILHVSRFIFLFSYSSLHPPEIFQLHLCMRALSLVGVLLALIV
jgi:hypothetical protein